MGEAASAEEAVELARSIEPGLIVLDRAIDGEITGIRAAPLSKEVAPNSKILLFTAYDLAAEARARPPSTATCARTSSTGSCPPSSAISLGNTLHLVAADVIQ